MWNALQSTAKLYNKIGKHNDRAFEKGKIITYREEDPH